MRILLILFMLIQLAIDLYANDFSGFGYGSSTGKHSISLSENLFETEMVGYNLQYIKIYLDENEYDRFSLKYNSLKSVDSYTDISYQSLNYVTNYDLINLNFGEIYSSLSGRFGLGYAEMFREDILIYKAQGVVIDLGFIIPIYYKIGNLLIGYEYSVNLIENANVCCYQGGAEHKIHVETENSIVVLW